MLAAANKLLLCLALYGAGGVHAIDTIQSHLRGPWETAEFQQLASTGTKLLFGTGEEEVCTVECAQLEDLTAQVEQLHQLLKTDGCGQLCVPTQVSNLDASYWVKASNLCVEVVGDNREWNIEVRDVDCARVMIKSGGTIYNVNVRARVPVRPSKERTL